MKSQVNNVQRSKFLGLHIISAFFAAFTRDQFLFSSTNKSQVDPLDLASESRISAFILAKFLSVKKVDDKPEPNVLQRQLSLGLGIFHGISSERTRKNHGVSLENSRRHVFPASLTGKWSSAGWGKESGEGKRAVSAMETFMSHLVLQLAGPLIQTKSFGF